MASLAGSQIKDSYVSLLKLDGNTDSTVAGADGNAIQVKTGDNDATPLYLNTDRIGIGTASPDTPLTIRSTTTAQIHLLDSSDATNLGLSLGFDDAGNTTSFISSIYNNDANRFDIRMKGNDTGDAKLTVLGSGNVGIGISNPSEALEINKSGANLKVVSDANVYLSLDSTQTNGDEWQIFNANSGTTSTLQFKNVDQSKVVMLLDETGKIGVNSTAPVATIDIVGTRTLNLTNTISDDTNKNAVITHSQYDSGTETEGFILMQGFSNAAINRVDIGGGSSQHNAVEQIRFFTAANATTATGTQAMHIDNAQNVSIGIDSPDTLMHIHKATAGSVDSNANAVLTIENNSHAGIQFLTPNSANNIIYFGDQDDNDVSYIGYLHSTNDLQFFINGGVSLQLESDGTANQEGNYIVNEQGRQNHVANTMSSPYYRFDGVDDKITIADTDNLSFTDGSNDKPFSISSWIYPTDATDWTIFQKGVNFASSEYGFYINTNDQLTIHCVDAGGSGTGVIGRKQTATIAENKWHHVVATYNGNGTASGLKVYLNGIQVDDADVNGNSYTKMGNSSDVAQIGFRDSEYSDGQVACVQVHNHELDATEVKELYSGASVPFKYKGANQTTLVTNGGFADASNWTAGSGWSIGSNVATGSTSNNYLTQTVSLTAGKKYRLSADFTRSSGSVVMYCGASAGDETEGTTVVSSAGNHSVEFLAQSDTDTIVFTGSAFSGTVTNVVLVPIGAVAEYDGSGIASDKWFDKSGNDLHGTITAGATAPSVENAPTGDDGLVYEEGSHEPSITGSTSGSMGLNGSFNELAYTRVGRNCTVTGLLYITSDSSINGNIQISLPFACSQENDSSDLAYGACQLGGTGTAINGTPVMRAQGGNSFVSIFVTPNDGGDFTELTHAEVDGTWFVGFTITYMVA